MSDPILRVQDLEVAFPSEAGRVEAVRGISFEVHPGRTLAIVGESGSGKSVTSLAVMGLLSENAAVSGSVSLAGRELLGLSDRDMSRVRGREIAMIFQDPLSALTPVYTVGDQLVEALQAHHRISKKAAWARAIELMRIVGIPRPENRVRSFPHEFSGGMRQRIVIAMAMANDPQVIIADEPTTALDVTIQAQILDVLDRAQQETGAAVILITHDMGVVAHSADDVVVMYGGRAVEQADVDSLFASPRDPYTIRLLDAIPRVDRPRARRLSRIDGLGSDVAAVADEPATPRDERPEVLRVSHLSRTFPLTRGSIFKRRVGAVHAVRDVSFDIRAGETLAIVGESGSGKTTTLLELMEMAPQEGTIVLNGTDVGSASPAEKRKLRRDIQIVFQDPMGALDPRMTVLDILAEPMIAMKYRGDVEARALELIALVGLLPEHADRFPSAFSGGQRQRIGIARALATSPKVIVLDEPVSALDVSIQADIINLLEDLKRKLGLAYVFVAHDLAVVRHIADRVAVMYRGEFVEFGGVDAVFERPQHDYTRALLSAIPIPDPAAERSRERILLRDEPAPQVEEDERPSLLARLGLRRRPAGAAPTATAEDPDVPILVHGGTRPTSEREVPTQQ